MKTRIKSYLIYLALFVFMTNCASQRTSTIVGGEYNETQDETDYFVLPYGSVSIPGKWTKTNYNTVSRQQFFTNSDSIIMAISFNRYDKFAFNQNGEYEGFGFVKAYYQWDSKYFVDSYGLQREVIKTDSVNAS